MASGDEQDRKPLVDAITRRTYPCPLCGGRITEKYLRDNPFDEFGCPHCFALIKTADLGRDAVEAQIGRGSRRCATELQVTYRTFETFKAHYTKNVGRGGMFIRTREPHEIGTQMELSLHVPGLAEPLHILCEVAHKRQFGVAEDEMGVGVKFLGMDEESRTALVAYLSSIASCKSCE